MRHEGLRKRLEDAGHRISPRDDIAPEAVAWLLDISVRTLDNWRSLDKGPLYARLGKRVWYPLTALVDYLDARLTQTVERRLAK